MPPISIMAPLTSTLPLDGTALLSEMPSLKFRWIIVEVHVSVGFLWYSVFLSVHIIDVVNILSDSFEEWVNTYPLSICLYSVIRNLRLQALTLALLGGSNGPPPWFFVNNSRKWRDIATKLYLLY